MKYLATYIVYIYLYTSNIHLIFNICIYVYFYIYLSTVGSWRYTLSFSYFNINIQKNYILNIFLFVFFPLNTYNLKILKVILKTKNLKNEN